MHSYREPNPFLQFLKPDSLLVSATGKQQQGICPRPSKENAGSFEQWAMTEVFWNFSAEIQTGKVKLPSSFRNRYLGSFAELEPVSPRIFIIVFTLSCSKCYRLLSMPELDVLIYKGAGEGKKPIDWNLLMATECNWQVGNWVRWDLFSRNYEEGGWNYEEGRSIS